MYFSETLTPVLVHLLNEWAVQILVLFSFALQVFLLTFGWIRRHSVSPLPRVLLWMAYQLADSTALFTLGHLSISSKLHQHELVAFWAPLLLVHLGGQDTITAYSIEDSGIWLRHMQTLVVQVSGAAYVMYKYIPGSETLVIVAAVLIFVVGVLKYVERIWALKCATLDSIWSSIDSDASILGRDKDTFFDEFLKRRHGLDAEEVLMAAHGLLDVCKGLFIGSRRAEGTYLLEVVQSFDMGGHLDELMEMELSLMYDILFTKAFVIHTWYGLCVRVTAPAATVAAFVLFMMTRKERYDRHDVAISYVLLVGALVLEMISLVKAAGSIWTRALLYDNDRSKEKKWRHWLHDELAAFRRLVGATRNRRWPGSVGQYNLLLSCARDKGGPAAAGKTQAAGTSSFLGMGVLSDIWGGLRPSQSAEVSGITKELVLRQVLRMVGTGKDIGSSPGMFTLQEFRLQELVGWSVQDIGFEDSIMAWHIATDVCMFKDRSNNVQLLEAIRVLSNYMMFLLVERPYMLPGPVRRSRYHHVRGALCGALRTAPGADHMQPEQRADWALRTGLRALANSFDAPADYDAGVTLADLLYHRPTSLQVIFGVWVEMLYFVADHCSRESHARQLSKGGELVTIVWLMASHAKLSYSSSRTKDV